MMRMKDMGVKEKEEEKEKEGAARMTTPGGRGRLQSRRMLSRSFSETSYSSYESALMGRAHGIVTDMLADDSLPPHVVSGLEALGNLLRPPETRRPLPGRPRASPMVSVLETHPYGLDSEESPFFGDRPSALAEKVQHGLHPSLLRRVTSGTWTTTTSATGMPTLEPAPCRRRTSSLRRRRSREDHTPTTPATPTPTQSPSSFSPSSPFGCAGPSNPFASQCGGAIPKSRSFSTPCERRRFVFRNVQLKGEGEEGQEEEGEGSWNGTTTSSRQLSSGNSRTSTAPETSVSQLGEDDERTTEDEQRIDRGDNTVKDEHDGTFSPRPDSGTAGTKDWNAWQGQQPSFTAEDVEESPLLQTSLVNEWDFPIFDLAFQERTFILSKMAYKLFTEVDLMDTFRIPEAEFISYFHSLELGYRENPYHNRVHATDVLHGVYYLTTRPVPGFVSTVVADTGSPPASSTGKNHEEKTLHHCPSFQADDDTYGVMGGNLTALELLALYTAAAIHDYDHPGRTNAFLVVTQAPQAILYNDRAVLENHHVASAWSLLLQDRHHNFLSGLEPAEFKRFRFLVIEIVLATDLKRHFEILAEFNAKVNEEAEEGGVGVDWSVETDRLLVLQATIKLADMSGPLKPLPLHLLWTSRITEEFYQQGDEESNLGLPVSPYMDRRHPQLAKLQDTFINHLVAPLCNAMATGGLLPGCWADDMKAEKDGDRSAPKAEDGEERRNWTVHCPLMENLKANHDHWARQLKEESAASSEEKTKVGPIKEESVESP
ncbi:cGMP-inhibited 3',5'-cyclic phosphodiesterase 3A-like isoform X2 [Babylonia areolata]|uniref:cGMP-inhibited 3',5'-cyclic phosphodiesterase 3A-like isoform X2 n=1 Tax=Babylonia areolata TaxID=304850 RepID=UPI003FD5B067